MRRIVVVIAGSLSLACSPKHDATPAADSTTQRTRDSVIGESRLPGATGVKGALRLSDSADARNARNAAISADQ